MKKLSLFILIFLSFGAFAQQQISLQDCYDLVAQNYPLAQQNTLLEQQNTLDLKIIETGRLPELGLSAQATYQSDVTGIPIAIPDFKPLNKDQYRATVSVNQLIYSGGSIDALLNAKSLALETNKKQVEVSLYQLKKQVNQLYYSVLLAQENKTLLIARTEQLAAKLKEVQSGIKYGILMPTSDKIIEAELLKIHQKITEVDETKKSLLQTLSSLIGQPIDSQITLQNETQISAVNTEIKRPELELFQLKKNEITASEDVISKSNFPKLFGFANGGYGNPGLNMLDNSFQTFYTLGLKVNWSVFDWNTSKKQRESFAITKDLIDTESEVFELNTKIELDQKQAEINKIETFIISDLEIIALRKQVLAAADSQLKNGVITPSAYITELTNLFEDQNTLITHKIQLQLAKANYNTIQGQ